MHHLFSIDGALHQAWLSRTPSGYALLEENGDVSAVALSLGADGNGALIVGGKRYDVTAAARGDTAWIYFEGEIFEVSLVDPVAHFSVSDHGSAADILRAPMPGVVIDAPATVGAAVAAGDTLVVIESMKLETAIKAPRDGVVAEVGFAVGQSFDRDAILVRLESEA